MSTKPSAVAYLQARPGESVMHEPVLNERHAVLLADAMNVRLLRVEWVEVESDGIEFAEEAL